MKKLIKLIIAISLLSTLSACFKARPESTFTFHTAQTRLTGLEQDIQDAELPLSGMKCNVNTQYFMSSNDLADIEAASVKLASGEELYGFYFSTTTIGKNRLLTATAGNQGAFIIVKESTSKEANKIIGARQIDATISNGKIFIIPEIELDSLEELDELIAKWKESIRRHRAIRDSLY